MSNFIFRDVFPNISKNVVYCTNKLAAEGQEAAYDVVHHWLETNSDAIEVLYDKSAKKFKLPHYSFYITNAEKEEEFIKSFGHYMAPVEVD